MYLVCLSVANKFDGLSPEIGNSKAYHMPLAISSINQGKNLWFMLQEPCTQHFAKKNVNYVKLAAVSFSQVVSHCFVGNN